MAGWVLICLSLCMSNFATVSLTDDERAALEMLCRCRKVEALVWKRARAFILLDAGYDPKIVCEILDIGPSVLMEWRFAYKADGLAFFGLKDYSPREGHLSFPQEEAVKEHFSEHPTRCVVSTRFLPRYLVFDPRDDFRIVDEVIEEAMPSFDGYSCGYEHVA